MKQDNLTSIRILGIDYEVNYSDTRKENGSELVGNVDNQACKITINNYINSQPHAGSVLLHEVIEAIDYRLQLQLNHEKICQLEAGLIQVIRDNPNLLKELSK